MDLSRYGEFAQFIPVNGKMDLGWGQANSGSQSALEALDANSSSTPYVCCISAVWLFQGFLDESHSLSQEIYASEGSYLHGIMHRREGDFSNAKYWFRKANIKSFYTNIESWVQDDSEIDNSVKDAFSSFDPFLLVDTVEAAGGSNDSLERVTFYELLAVLDHCHNQI